MAGHRPPTRYAAGFYAWPRTPARPLPPVAPAAKATEYVVVKGAREHNLKGVDLTFPRDSLTTFTGVSGSGKSSLAYHTIYQEGQRRFSRA